MTVSCSRATIRPMRHCRDRRRHAVLVLWLLTAALGGGSPTTALAQPRCNEPLPRIFDRVAPAVVFIAATSIDPYRLVDRVTQVVGSGFVFDAAEGFILTNAHVVFGRQALTVSLRDGTQLPAELVGADPIFDVAVLRIPRPARGTLPTVPLGDSDRIRVGQDVVAIGNPLGLAQTLTRGVVSALNRILPETPFSLQEPLIQTDTPINPGNSGGPLLNRCGHVIGITTAVIPDAQNIGFAIPMNLVRAMLPTLASEGRIIRPWVGFHGTLVDGNLREWVRIPIAPTACSSRSSNPGAPPSASGCGADGWSSRSAAGAFSWAEASSRRRTAWHWPSRTRRCVARCRVHSPGAAPASR